jgi:SAM-dependent methyltransferase
MSEVEYYENTDLWKNGRHLPGDMIRYAACEAMVPASVRSLLDVGAGNGLFMAALEKLRPGVRLMGVERSRAAAEAKVCESEIIVESAESMSLPDRAVDLVAALEVIEHLPFGVYERTLSELERVASKYILISVPYNEARRPVRCPYCACKFNPNYHMRSFDIVRMKDLFGSFECVKSDKVNVPAYIGGSVLSKLYRIATGRKNRFPTSAVCPQCGFQGRLAAASNRDVNGGQHPWVRNIKRMWPQRPNPIWFVALYKRVP